MVKKSLLSLVAAIGFGAVLPGHAQEGQQQYVLPEGNGKETVQMLCTGCHDLRRVVNSNYSQEEWHNVVNMMNAAGAAMTPAQMAIVSNYLIASFPQKQAKPAAAVVPGDTRVSFKEWTVPTPGSRPHDPLAAADGSVWYTGQMANKLGRFDPKTQQFKEYPIPGPRSGAHGLTEDKDGNIWFGANWAGYIGKLDPKTGAFTNYPMPDPNARDPHTPIFDKEGILWFTLQNSNMVGRLDPRSGDIKLVTMPTPKAQPYGMVFNSQGVLFFDEFGSNKLASIDSKTMAITEYPLPDPGSRPRRIAATSDDMIWYGDYSRGRLGRLDPKTGKVTEYLSPGGPRSQPYGMAVLNDIIWYNESGVKPNTLVRFDPKTEKFQTWTIPSGGGVVRNMMPTRDGQLALATSGVNGIALVEVK